MLKIKQLLLGAAVALFAPTGFTDPILDASDLSNKKPQFNCKDDKGIKTCEIYLVTQIGDPSSYLDIYKLLSNLTNKDQVNLHLAGPGGDGYGMVYLVNAFKNTKAHVTSYIDGPVASAQAVMAVMNKDVKLTGDAYILFHSISGSNMTQVNCANTSGQDRGIAVYTKCVEDTSFTVEFFNSTIKRYVYPVMTEEEKTKYEQGHDVIITGQELMKRLNK